MKTLQIKIDCGETTCSTSSGAICMCVENDPVYTGKRCRLFNHGLRQDRDGWLQRCPACLEAEKK